MENPVLELEAERLQRFGGVERLLGRGALARLGAAHVAVVGLGGVGSWTVEGLARSGVGALTLIDLDDVCLTNSNRQLPALDGNFGRPKAEVLAERARLISPTIRTSVVADYFMAENAADSANSALRSTQNATNEAFDRMSDKVEDAKNLAAPLISRLTAQAEAAARRGADVVRDTSAQIRDKAAKAQETTVGYIKDEPVKAILIAAATGAALMALIALVSRSRD